MVQGEEGPRLWRRMLRVNLPPRPLALSSALTLLNSMQSGEQIRARVVGKCGGEASCLLDARENGHAALDCLARQVIQGSTFQLSAFRVEPAAFIRFPQHF